MHPDSNAHPDDHPFAPGPGQPPSDRSEANSEPRRRGPMPLEPLSAVPGNRPGDDSRDAERPKAAPAAPVDVKENAQAPPPPAHDPDLSSLAEPTEPPPVTPSARPDVEPLSMGLEPPAAPEPAPVEPTFAAGPAPRPEHEPQPEPQLEPQLEPQPETQPEPQPMQDASASATPAPDPAQDAAQDAVPEPSPELEEYVPGPALAESAPEAPAAAVPESASEISANVDEPPSLTGADEVEDLELDFQGELDLPEPDGTGTATVLTSSSISPRHQLEAWLAAMVQSRASDLILRASGKPSCRVDSKIQFLPGRVPAAGALLEVLDGIVGEERMKAWRQCGSVDIAIQLDGLGRFRLNAYKQMGEPALVLRRISEDPPMLENLGLPTGELKRLASKKRGIILVTGIAGSGKSTTLAAIIQYMNLHFERHVVTLEDPVEMLFREDRCVISQREVGTDCPSFHEGLRHALRQSPDVLLIGEMRDQETVNAALDATETGHLVLSTLHTVNAPQTVDRILSFFPAEQHEQARARLAENLGAVLSQRLIPRTSGKGMVPAFELMSSTPHVRELLTDGRTAELAKVIDSAGEGGLISFNMSLRQLVEQGIVDLEIALSASDRPDELMMALRGFQHGGGKHQKKSESGSNGLRMAD